MCLQVQLEGGDACVSCTRLYVQLTWIGIL